MLLFAIDQKIHTPPLLLVFLTQKEVKRFWYKDLLPSMNIREFKSFVGVW